MSSSDLYAASQQYYKDWAANEELAREGYRPHRVYDNPYNKTFDEYNHPTSTPKGKSLGRKIVDAVYPWLLRAFPKTTPQYAQTQNSPWVGTIAPLPNHLMNLPLLFRSKPPLWTIPTSLSK